MTIEEDEEKNGKGKCYLDILQYLKDGTYLEFAKKNNQLTIRICGERLYQRSFDGIHLFCVIAREHNR